MWALCASDTKVQHHKNVQRSKNSVNSHSPLEPKQTTPRVELHLVDLSFRENMNLRAGPYQPAGSQSKQARIRLPSLHN